RHPRSTLTPPFPSPTSGPLARTGRCRAHGPVGAREAVNIIGGGRRRFKNTRRNRPPLAWGSIEPATPGTAHLGPERGGLRPGETVELPRVVCREDFDPFRVLADQLAQPGLGAEPQVAVDLG